MKILSLRVELFHAYRKTDGHGQYTEARQT